MQARGGPGGIHDAATARVSSLALVRKTPMKTFLDAIPMTKVRGRAIAHASKPKGRDLKVAVSEFTLLHVLFSIEVLARLCARLWPCPTITHRCRAA
jgi:hypothetical protein